MHYIRIWSSRTGNVLHSSRESAFACLLFNKVEEVQHSIVIPSDSHSGINYPPFANADGFETTDCLECLQILDILIYGRRVYFKAGDWTSCTILGYGLPERETCCILSVNQLLHACLLTKWKKCNILSLFLQIHIVESTIPRRSSVPLSLQKGAAYGMLPICKAFVCLPFYKRSFHIPLQSPWGVRGL